MQSSRNGSSMATYTAYSSLWIQTLRYLLLTLLPNCVADESFLLNCSSDFESSRINATVVRTAGRVIVSYGPLAVRVGDRVIMSYQPLQTASLYPTDDCTQFNESLKSDNNRLIESQLWYHHDDNINSLIAENQTLLAWYRFQPTDVNTTYSFLCKEDNTTSGCQTTSRKFEFQVHQPGSSTKSNSRSNQPSTTMNIRSTSRAIDTNEEGVVDHGIVFLVVVATLGAVAMIMDCCVDYAEYQRKKTADSIAREINAET